MIQYGWRFFTTRHIGPVPTVVAYLVKFNVVGGASILSPTGGVVELDEDSTFPPECGFTLPEAAAQELIDGLWQCGIRPTQGAGSAGALAATERHLADLQRLVFEKEKP